MKSGSSYQSGSTPSVAHHEDMFVNRQPRRFTDWAWSIAFYVYAVIIIAWGATFVASFNASQFIANMQAVNTDSYSQCSASPTGSARHLLQAMTIEQTAHETAVIAVLISVVASIGVAVLFLQLVIHNAKAMVVTALWGTSVVVPAVVGVLLFVFGAFVQKLLGALFLALALLSSFLLTCCWGQWIQMLSDLLSVSGRALGANANLITVSLCIKFALLTLWGLVVFLIVAASSHGTITQNPYAIPNPAGGDSCIQTAPSGGAMGGASSSEGPSTVSCCSWAMTGDAIAYIVFAALFMLWSGAIAFEMRLFMVAHVTARWYFLPAGETLQGYPATEAVLIAAGPQFGTVSLGGVLIAIVEILRAIANYVQDASAESDNILMCLLGYIVSGFLFCIAGLLDAVTKFATIRAAMTGDNFWEAAQGAKDLLLRNALDAFVVWDFPQTILGFCGLIVAAAFGALVGGSVDLIVRLEAVAGGASVSAAEGAAHPVIVGVVAGAISFVVLHFLNGLLIDIIDTVYLCFATDRDLQRVSRKEVHDIYAQLPCSTGVAVKNPDGGYQYGAPR